MIQYRPELRAVDFHELERLLRDLGGAEHTAESSGRDSIEVLSQRLITITAEQFPPGPLEISLECDPDEPDEKYLVFTVEATGDSATLLARRRQWHLAVASVVGENAIKYRLSIYPR